MERLTDYSDDECTYIIGVGNKTCEEFCKYVVDGCRNCYIQQVFKKLADYEDLEEQGLLVRLPCPIGTTVWDIYGTGIRKNVVSGIEYGKDGRWFLWANEDEWLGELNVVVFLTREEAEKKLEEIQNDKT
ncbi:hypothetical protein DWY46_05290 [Blautia obeum]|uniref:Uncharacterized protein n=1 Tax=Blautia obeum TaxID=40520 RepID=A0A412EUL2_9FIRM|nr:hypothetical protein [Blautia obeum]RGR50797.1 hypothetical protein DWY46_05290 [Blautia obeum]